MKAERIDVIIEIRHEARKRKDWGLSDELREVLDLNNVFVFDTKEGQDVYYLTPEYFKWKDKLIETVGLSKRQYVEYRIKRDIRAENNFDAWLFTQKI